MLHCFTPHTSHLTASPLTAVQTCSWSHLAAARAVTTPRARKRRSSESSQNQKRELYTPVAVQLHLADCSAGRAGSLSEPPPFE
eukprot:UN3500